MIGAWLYLRARRRPRSVFDRYLVAARDRGAWRGIVAGTFDLPGWLRPTRGPLHENDVRILFGRPPETLLVLDAIEAATGRVIRDVWPRLRGYIHEGVDFAPYRDLFRRRLGSDIACVEGDRDGPCDLNAFGERLSHEAMDAAVDAAQRGCGGRITGHRFEAEYPTATESRGRHVIYLECVTPPDDLAEFARALDAALPHPARKFVRPPIVRIDV